MRTQLQQKTNIASEIEGLSENEIEKIIKMIRLLKAEFLKKEKGTSFYSFKKARGAWGDVDTEEIYQKLNEDWDRWEPSKSV